ncbi:MAG: aminopeptidase N [Desulfococcaceae bacterium]|jgi:aminopeptidase N|nr:aminopeptidase N [Desulfococcaceae bacterium]
MTAPSVKYLKDYRPPAYRVEETDLHVELHEKDTLVRSRLQICRNRKQAGENTPLILDGQQLETVSVEMNGSPLPSDAYEITEKSLTIRAVPETFVLTTECRIQPRENTSLDGLYNAGGLFCTQCEAEGFRKITWFPDRPDVMSRFTCTITADKEKYPVLLSNGNLMDSGESEGGRHWARWQDPFKKPSYLFALVAGDLFCLEDRFRTASGRDIALRIYVEHENRDKCGYAMEALKKSMKWDEEVFGLEYDLDIYMIVAVNDFNMGAMENKGLNVFNSKYVLADPRTATDTDFWNIDRVIAHEYFHNWTGNRVTLKNWFQLSLKEGLTVFRDQEFSSDLTSRPVKRISDVRGLRSYQFPEDAGPMAHPVRPASYMEMNNFYTMTVYEKGAEVIRMIQQLLGKEGFRSGMDLYFQRHDGQAVCIEDFISAMEDANNADLKQFMLWYSQAGTPQVQVDRQYDAGKKIYRLTFRQHCPPTPDMREKLPMHIPLAVGLLDRKGREMPLQLQGETAAEGGTRMLELRKAEQTYAFLNVAEEPVPSLLRGFSAPVKLRAGYSDEEQAFLFAHDPDEFNRWDAGQCLFSKIMLRLARDYQKGKELKTDESLISPFRKTLLDKKMDKSFISQALTLPTESELGILMSETSPIDPEAVFQVRTFIGREIARRLRDEFLHIYEQNQDEGPYSPDPLSVGRRNLKNLALAYLGKLGTDEFLPMIYGQFKSADNMSDELAALSVLSHIDCKERGAAIDAFYEKWKSDILVLDKWFSIQAGSRVPGVLETVNSLLKHPAFSIRNPNKVRALIGAFCGNNPRSFHDPSGAGYAFIADRILELNRLNPQIAARLAGVFNHWKKYESGRKEKMKEQLDRISKAPDLSVHVYEIVSKALV